MLADHPPRMDTTGDYGGCGQPTTLSSAKGLACVWYSLTPTEYCQAYVDEKISAAASLEQDRDGWNEDGEEVEQNVAVRRRRSRGHCAFFLTRMGFWLRSLSTPATPA